LSSGSDGNGMKIAFKNQGAKKWKTWPKQRFEPFVAKDA
jgi:hypothetical protein